MLKMVREPKWRVSEFPTNIYRGPRTAEQRQASHGWHLSEAPPMSKNRVFASYVGLHVLGVFVPKSTKLLCQKLQEPKRG